MSETKFSFCTLCSTWILLGPHKQNSDPVTSSGSYVVTEETPRGRVAHILLSGRRLAAKKYHHPPPDQKSEPEVQWVHPKPSEPEAIPSFVPQEVAEILSQPPPASEPKWEPDESLFYEVEIVGHNNIGMTGRLSNFSRVFIHNRVTRNADYPIGSKVLVRIRPSGPDAINDYHALESWREPEPDSSKASLGDIYGNE